MMMVLLFVVMVGGVRVTMVAVVHVCCGKTTRIRSISSSTRRDWCGTSMRQPMGPFFSS